MGRHVRNIHSFRYCPCEALLFVFDCRAGAVCVVLGRVWVCAVWGRTRCVLCSTDVLVAVFIGVLCWGLQFPFLAFLPQRCRCLCCCIICCCCSVRAFGGPAARVP